MIESIRVRFDEEGLFGADQDAIEAEGTDIAASKARYGEAVTNHLYDAYPAAELDVAEGYPTIEVNGLTDHDEVPWIEQIVERVWNGDDWLVAF